MSSPVSPFLTFSPNFTFLCCNLYVSTQSVLSSHFMRRSTVSRNGNDRCCRPVECSRAFRYYSWSSLHPCNFSVPTEFRLHHSRILQVKVSVCIVAQALFLDCILLCCIPHPQTIKWKVCIFICVIQSSHLMIHSLSPTFYVSSPWRVDKVDKHFHVLVRLIHLAFYLHSVFAAFYVF